MLTFIRNSSFIGAAIGTMIEYYDYGLFLIFLPIISPVFFPSDSAYTSLLYAYLILLPGIIFRPLGGLAFGYLGDLLGRKKALLLSMYGIAISTFLIGVTPSYTAIGKWAIVMIVICKTVQTMCFAGEYNGAGIYVVEHAREKNEIAAGSLLSAIMLSGSLVASIIGFILTSASMPSWSWRIAFMLGGCFGLFGIFYRKNMQESPEFTLGTRQSRPLKELFRLYPKELIAGCFIGCLVTVPYTTVGSFITPVLMTNGYYTAHQCMLFQTCLAILAVAMLIVVGLYANRFTPGFIMRMGCGLLFIFSYPLLALVDTGNPIALVFALMTIVALNEIFLGPSNAYLKRLFPMEYRYRGSSFSFSLGMACLGGITPIIEHYLYGHTGKFSSLAIWIAFICLCTLISLYMVERTPQQSKLLAQHG